MRYLIILTLMSFIYVYGLEIPKNNWKEVYKQTKNKEVIKSLFELTDDFKRVEFDEDKIVLEPKPVVKRITINGNRSFLDSEIKAITGLREGSSVDTEIFENIPLRIIQFYQDRGFFATTVDVRYQQEDNWLYVDVEIDEGKKSKLKEIKFQLDQTLSTVEIENFKKVMGLKYGKSYSLSIIQDAVDRLRRHLMEQGYYDSYIEIANIDARKDGYLGINILINLGTKYIVRFYGNEKIAESRLKELLTFKEEGFNYYQIGQTLKNIINEYQNQGFLNIKVNFEIQESEERFEESYPVFTFVSFYVEEGNRFKVGKIEIASDITNIETKIKRLIVENDFYDRKKFLDFLEHTVSNLNEAGYITAYYRIEEIPENSDIVNISVYIFRKELYILKSVEFKNYSVDKRKLNLKLPKIYNPVEMLELQERLRKLAIDNGYYDVKVLLDVNMDEVDGKIEVKATYMFDLGERYRNGFLFVYGSKNLDPSVVVAQFETQKGFFDDSRLNLSLDRLYSSKLFESVNLYLLEDEEKKVVNKAVIIHDDKRGLFQGGFGYSTDQQFKVSILAVLKNLFRYGFELSGYFERSNFQTNYKASFGNRLLPKNFSSFVSAYSAQQFRRHFDLNQDGFELSVEKKHNLWVNSILTFSSYRAEVSNTSIPTYFDSYKMSKISWIITDDHRDNKVDTKKGYILSLKVEKSFGRFDFSKGEVVGRYFVNPVEPLILSTKISTGYTFSNIDSIPLGERYFIGGISSLRGFALEEVAGEAKTGGNSFVILNNDLRLLVYPKYSIYLLGFLDLGNVYHTKDSLKSLYLRKSAGVGIYVPTPVGAIVFDVAKRLDKKPGESEYRIEFSIGANF